LRASLPLFSVRRADIETFARELGVLGRARATVTRRLCTIAGFYKYAVEEELLDHSQLRTSAVPGWITSPTPPPWTATSSARFWSPPGSSAASPAAQGLIPGMTFNGSFPAGDYYSPLKRSTIFINTKLSGHINRNPYRMRVGCLSFITSPSKILGILISDRELGDVTDEPPRTSRPGSQSREDCFLMRPPQFQRQKNG
jgi:hypothetical protein